MLAFSDNEFSFPKCSDPCIAKAKCNSIWAIVNLTSVELG